MEPNPTTVAVGAYGAWLVAALALYAVVLAYSVLIAGQLLLGLFVASFYFVWRFLRAFEAIADAQQRMAAAEERAADAEESVGER